MLITFLVYVINILVVHSYYSIPRRVCHSVQYTYSKTLIFSKINNDDNVSNFIPLSKLSSLLFNNFDNYNEPSIFISGFNENQLEELDDMIYNVTNKNINTIILNENLKNMKLKELVKKSFLLKYDHVIPDNEYSTSNPFVLFHSFNETEIRQLMKYLRILFMNNIVFAVVVKNSLEKTLNILINEIFEDYNNKKQNV